jgi:2-polyprenyl-3-methyl-5-hydroxy-6-metoxy-1,4-benzoquinol methylase
MTVQPAGNYYDKYHTKNPIARRIMQGFLSQFSSLIVRQPERVAVEVGCGEGELCMIMARAGFRVEGYDIAPEAIDEARRRTAGAGLSIPFEVKRIDELPGRVKAPLLVCCEVLEHIDDPEAALDQLAAMANPYLLASVPNEPLWRVLNVMRGKYLGSLGNTPGHVTHWSSGRFRSFLERRFQIVELHKPLPWTMALCKVK